MKNFNYPAGSGKSQKIIEAINKKQYPVIEVLPDGKPDWYEGAYCLLFVYSKYKGNFIIKGYRREVEKFLKENYTHYFYYASMWNDGRVRGHWKFWKENEVTIFEPSKLYKSWKYKVVKYEKFTSTRVVELLLKRLPKRWIKEFDEL